MDPSASLSDNRRHMTPGCYQKRNDLPIKKALPSSPPSRPCGYVSLCAFCSFALHRWRVLLLQPFPPPSLSSFPPCVCVSAASRVPLPTGNSIHILRRDALFFFLSLAPLSFFHPLLDLLQAMRGEAVVRAGAAALVVTLLLIGRFAALGGGGGLALRLLVGLSPGWLDWVAS